MSMATKIAYRLLNRDQLDAKLKAEVAAYWQECDDFKAQFGAAIEAFVSKGRGTGGSVPYTSFMSLHSQLNAGETVARENRLLPEPVNQEKLNEMRKSTQDTRTLYERIIDSKQLKTQEAVNELIEQVENPDSQFDRNDPLRVFRAFIALARLMPEIEQHPFITNSAERFERISELKQILSKTPQQPQNPLARKTAAELINQIITTGQTALTDHATKSGEIEIS